MGLRLKFNIALLFITLIGLGISGFFSHQILQKNARQEVLEMARVMMESAIAVRSYTVNEVRPLLKVQQRRQFIAQTVPAYAATQYIKTLQQTHPDFSYKEAALNPTNPANRATTWEADIISWFRNHVDEPELTGERTTPLGPQLYLSKPITIKNPSCLGCHSTPAEAPSTLINTYGSNNGFGWKLDEIIGAQIVSVPMSLPLARAQDTFLTFMVVLMLIFIAGAAILNLVLHFVILKPVAQMSRKADQISLGNLTVEELRVKGNDELASLGRSFNRMHRSLKNAVELLDESDN